ncbi:N-acetylmuramidase domain-containing protein [Alkalilacustris brevis]|uniref:N-acetylmuramidase domain-containing protein n=1 Tax=Alkalilacustris brevis TaxID=2026338 RepID=UPI0012D2EB3C|nr:N-acetylmuramidase domain-containing protein [Alkalilacustris brevis]
MDTFPWQGAARALPARAFADAAKVLGCAEAELRAVWEVEAGGRHFLPDRSLLRRFEPHHFPAGHWQALGFAPGRRAPWRASLALPGAAREAMLCRAFALDAEAALRAASWGAPQIMGFNCREAGFGSAQEMVVAMAGAAEAQLAAFVALIRAWGLGTALRAHDWERFARRYNGSGQAAEYARRMEAVYRRHGGGAKSPVVLRVGARGPQVRQLQAALGVADDGAFGPETLAAVRSFQGKAGLPVDGVVGARSWAALEGRAAAGGTPVHPPAQPTPADALADQLRGFAGAAAAMSALAATLGEFRAVLPDQVFTLAAFGAVGFALVGAGAWAWRRVRA